MADDAIGYIVMQYPARGLAPERADFEDKVKAEKAFTDAKMAAILWQSRPVSTGLGWIKLKEKETPPPAPPAPAKPAVPAAAAAKPAVPAAAAKPAAPAAAPANPVASAPPPAAAAAKPADPVVKTDEPPKAG